MNRSIGTWRGKGRACRNAGVAVTAALALVTTGCGAGGSSTNTPGVTADTITLGTTQSLTGPTAPAYAKLAKALDAWFQHVNDEGGINGRKVKLLTEDDGYNPTNTATKTRKLVLEDKVFALLGSLGTPTHTAVLDFINQNKVPDLMVSSGSVSWDQPKKYPNTFGWQLDYEREGKILASYVKDKFPGKTYCSFGQGDDFGADGVKGVEEVLGSGALKDKESYTVTDPNVAPAIGKLQAAKCDVVFSFSLTGFTALALGTSAKLGYKAQWVVSNVGADPTALAGYLKDAAKPLTEGVISSHYFALPSEADNSWIKLFNDVNTKYNPGVPLDDTMVYGYSLAYTATQALKAAGKDLTRQSLIDAMEKGGFKGPGLAPFAYSKNDHSGFTGAEVTQIEDLKATKISPVYTTDHGSGAVVTYDGAAPDAPSGGMPQ